MKYSKVIAIVFITLLSGCGSDVTAPSSSSNGTNTTSLNTSDPNQFVITVTANNVGSSASYYHVLYGMDNSIGNSVLSNGTNYTGSLTATCVQGTVTATTTQFACTVHYNTSSPIGDPADAISTITLNRGQSYRVFQEQLVLTSSNVVTEVGTITIP